MDLEREIIAYAGPKYAEPRSVDVASLDLFDFEDINDLIEAVIAFRAEHANLEIVSDFEKYDGAEAVFRAYRSETPQEVATCVEGYRLCVMNKMAQRKAEYERMKREFGAS